MSERNELLNKRKSVSFIMTRRSLKISLIVRRALETRFKVSPINLFRWDLYFSVWRKYIYIYDIYCVINVISIFNVFTHNLSSQFAFS